MRGKGGRERTECWLRAVMTANGMPTPIILSVIADRSSWPLNSRCTKGGKRKSQVNKITQLLVLVSGWQLSLDCLHVKHVGDSLAARVEFTPPPLSCWSAHVCSATREVKGQGFCNYTGECEHGGDISQILTLWVQIFPDLYIFFSPRTLAMLCFPVEAQRVVQVSDSVCVGGTLRSVFQQAGLVRRRGPELSKVCHRFLPALSSALSDRTVFLAPCSPP